MFYATDHPAGGFATVAQIEHEAGIAHGLATEPGGRHAGAAKENFNVSKQVHVTLRRRFVEGMILFSYVKSYLSRKIPIIMVQVMADDVRNTLERLVRESSTTYGELSRLLGRNPAYIQQFVKRGSPRKLDEEDRRTLARFFGVDEEMLGAPDRSGSVPDQSDRESADGPRWRPRTVEVPRLALGASAGLGTLDEREEPSGVLSFDARWLRALGARPGSLSIIRVDGESMAPTLGDGDEIMVDRDDAADRLRDGIYVLRMGDALMVKRIALGLRSGRFSVRSDNSLYPTWDDVDPATVRIIGRVVWTGRRVH